MAQRQTHKARSHSKTTTPSTDQEPSSFEASSQSACRGEPGTMSTVETEPNELQMNGDSRSMERLSINRYRHVTLGLGLVYFIWLVFLAWIAYKVLAA